MNQSMVAGMSDRANSACVTCGQLVAPLVAILSELRVVLASLSDDVYVRPMGPRFSDASIGGHVRHCLDHARALADARTTVIDYDHRARGTEIEHAPAAAIREVDLLLIALHSLSNTDAARPVHVAVMPTRDARSVLLASTLARELAFVLSHTIHHNATIRGMIIDAGYDIPNTFGFAPSTLAHRDGSSCAH